MLGTQRKVAGARGDGGKRRRIAERKAAELAAAVRVVEAAGLLVVKAK